MRIELVRASETLAAAAAAAAVAAGKSWCIRCSFAFPWLGTAAAASVQEYRVPSID